MMMSITNLSRIQLIPRCFFQVLQVRVAIINMCSPNCRINIVCIYSGYIHTAMEYAVCVMYTLLMLCLCIACHALVISAFKLCQGVDPAALGADEGFAWVELSLSQTHIYTRAQAHSHKPNTHTHGTRSCLDNSMYSGKVVCGSSFKDTGYACIWFFFWFCFNVLSRFNAHATRSWDYEKRCCTVGLVRGGAR